MGCPRMFCHECGSNLHTDAKFCRSCGSRVPDGADAENVRLESSGIVDKGVATPTLQKPSLVPIPAPRSILACVVCNQDDSINKISNLVGSSSSNIKMRGNTSSWGTGFGGRGGIGLDFGRVGLAGRNVTDLAKQLSPPSPPKKSQQAQGCFSILALGGAFAMFAHSDTIRGIGFTVILIAVLGYFVNRKKERKKFGEEMEAWTRRLRRWDTLFYCSRCDRVYAPGTSVAVPPGRIDSLLT